MHFRILRKIVLTSIAAATALPTVLQAEGIAAGDSILATTSRGEVYSAIPHEGRGGEWLTSKLNIGRGWNKAVGIGPFLPHDAAYAVKNDGTFWAWGPWADVPCNINRISCGRLSDTRPTKASRARNFTDVQVDGGDASSEMVMLTTNSNQRFVWRHGDQARYMGRWKSAHLDYGDFWGVMMNGVGLVGKFQETGRIAWTRFGGGYKQIEASMDKGLALKNDWTVWEISRNGRAKQVKRGRVPFKAKDIEIADGAYYALDHQGRLWGWGQLYAVNNRNSVYYQSPTLITDIGRFGKFRIERVRFRSLDSDGHNGVLALTDTRGQVLIHKGGSSHYLTTNQAGQKLKMF